MTAQELLAKIRPLCVQRASQSLAQDETVRQAIAQQLEKFYDLLEQAMHTGNSAWLDHILLDWINAPTLSQLQGGENNAALALNKTIAATSEVSLTSLSEGEALSVLMAVMPYYAYALEKVARTEMEARMNFMSQELSDVQQKLEKLDRTKSNFISVAAHELKTPLTLIEGYASMIRDMLGQANDAQVTPFVKGINTGVARMRQVVDDMIDVSLIDNNMLSLDFQPLTIGGLLNLLKNELEATIKERQQTFTLLKFPGNDLWVYADSERLYQAMKNIFTNAIKYTPNKGRVTVDGRLLPGFIEIIVTDTGIGISPENQTLIFEKFGQVGSVNLHSSGRTKFKGGGPGLGLPITRGIIEAHGGTIWVESPGYDEHKCPGSTFHILIPTRTEPSDPSVIKLFGKVKKTNDKESHA